MSRRRTPKRLGESITSDAPTRRIYGSDVVQLGALLDLSNNWTDESLSTALCLSLGRPGLAEVDELSGRLKRPLPGRSSLASHLADHHQLQISREAVDHGICKWVGDDSSRRILALGLLTSPPRMSDDDIELQWNLLMEAAQGARAIPLGWPLASSVAANAGSHRMSLREIHLAPEYQLTSWEVLQGLAALASVDSASSNITARAAASSLASGIVADQESGLAAVFLLLRSSWSPRFDQLGFGSLRLDDRPVGSLLGWIGDLYVWFQLTAQGWNLPFDRARALIQPWPFDSYDSLIAGAAIANGIDESVSVGDGVEPAVEDLRKLTRSDVEKWAREANLDADRITNALDSIPDA